MSYSPTIVRERYRDGAAVVKALTVLQPYAHLIATGAKRVENRNWYTPYRGPLVIHAGRGRTMLDDADAYGIAESEMTFGAIVAVAELAACVMVRDLPDDLKGHAHAHGPFCWILHNVHRCEPLPFRGAQSLWILPRGTTLKGLTLVGSSSPIGDWTP